MSVPTSASSDGHEGIAVALTIDSQVLRNRVLKAVLGAGDAAIFVHELASADVLITDRGQQSDIPTILIGHREVIARALGQGYAGALLPSFSPAQLRIIIEAAAHGLVCVNARGGRALSMPVSDGNDYRRDDSPRDQLTPREVEVLGLLIAGAPNKQIARELEISVHTVKFHVASIITKLGASSRTDAVARAIRSGNSMI